MHNMAATAASTELALPVCKILLAAVEHSSASVDTEPCKYDGLVYMSTIKPIVTDKPNKKHPATITLKPSLQRQFFFFGLFKIFWAT